MQRSNPTLLLWELQVKLVHGTLSPHWLYFTSTRSQQLFGTASRSPAPGGGSGVLEQETAHLLQQGALVRTPCFKHSYISCSQNLLHSNPKLIQSQTAAVKAWLTPKGGHNLTEQQQKRRQILPSCLEERAWEEKRTQHLPAPSSTTAGQHEHELVNMSPRSRSWSYQHLCVLTLNREGQQVTRQEISSVFYLIGCLLTWQYFSQL